MENNNLKAIDTAYKGYLFRSRLEARYAIMFDELGWKWEYESEGYKLKSGWYLPDFYFPDYNIYAEVKPRELNHRELQLCKDLSDSCAKVILLEGQPECKRYRVLENGYFRESAYFYPSYMLFAPTPPLGFSTLCYFDYLEDAVDKAKSARFEHIYSTPPPSWQNEKTPMRFVSIEERPKRLPGQKFSLSDLKAKINAIKNS